MLDYVQQQKDPKSGELEGLSYEFDLCEAVATWEQVGVAESLFKVSVHKIGYSLYSDGLIGELVD